MGRTFLPVDIPFRQKMIFFFEEVKIFFSRKKINYKKKHFSVPHQEDACSNLVPWGMLKKVLTESTALILYSYATQLPQVPM